MVITTIIVILHIVLLSKLIFFPYPELFIYPYLTKIGLVPYKDILDQHFPGLMFFPVNLATLGIDTPGEMRILQYVVVAVTHFLIYIVSRKLSVRSWSVYLPNLLYIIWHPYLEGYVLWIDNFVAPMLMASFYFAINFEKTKNDWNLFYSGLLLGLSILFKQVTLPLILFYYLYIYINHKKTKYFYKFTFGLLIPGIYLIYFILSSGILTEFIYWSITYNLTVFSELGRKSVTLNEIIKIFPIIGYSFIMLVYSIYQKRDNIPVFWKLLFLYLTGSMFFAYARFDFVHLQPALVFSVLIVNEVFKQLRLGRNFKFLLTATAAILTIAILVIGYRSLFGNKIYFYDDTEREIAKEVRLLADSNNTIFAFGVLPHIYQMTGTRPPGDVFVFQFPWFMTIAEPSIYSGILSDPPGVIIRDSEASVSGINLTKHMSQINTHINKYYKVVRTYDNIEILVPN